MTGLIVLYLPHTAEPVSTTKPVSTTRPVSTTKPVSTTTPVPTPGPTTESVPEPPHSAVNVIIISTVLASALVIIIVVIATILLIIKSIPADPEKPYKAVEEHKSIQDPKLIQETKLIQEPKSVQEPKSIQEPKLIQEPSDLSLVLVLYSPDSPEKDKELALHLVSCLSNHEIQIQCHDCFCIRQSAPSWLQEELRRASTVLCVCNAQFQREWDQETTSYFPLVSSLRELVYGLLSQSISLSTKFAIVLLRESDRKHIPCDYLSSARTFLVTDVEDIAFFVKEIPKYATK